MRWFYFFVFLRTTRRISSLPRLLHDIIIKYIRYFFFFFKYYQFPRTELDGRGSMCARLVRYEFGQNPLARVIFQRANSSRSTRLSYSDCRLFKTLFVFRFLWVHTNRVEKKIIEILKYWIEGRKRKKKNIRRNYSRDIRTDAGRLKLYWRGERKKKLHSHRSGVRRFFAINTIVFHFRSFSYWNIKNKNTGT